MERRGMPENLAEAGFEAEPKPKFEVETIERQDSNGLQYNEYIYTVGNSKFSVYFKNQENLFDPKLAADKVMVEVGDVSYSREPEQIKRNEELLEEEAKVVFRVNLVGQYIDPYHFESEIAISQRGGGYRFKDFKIDKTEAVYSKPATGLKQQDLAVLTRSFLEGKAMFVADTQPRSLADLAVTIRNSFSPDTFPPARIDVNDLAALEDLIVAASFDNNRKLSDNSQESRNSILRALLGDNDSAEELQAVREENQDNFPPYLVAQCRNSIEAYIRIIHDHKEREANESNELIKKNIHESIRAYQERIKSLENFVVSCDRDGNSEIPEELIEELDKHVAIHMTEYQPDLSEDGQLMVRPHSQATGTKVGRLTLHFAIDGTATAAFIGQNDWSQYRFAVLCPLGQMVKNNGYMANFIPADTYWVVDPNKEGIKIPDNSTIICRDDDDLDRLQKQVPVGIEIIGSQKNNSEKIRRVLREKYNTSVRSLGNDTWIGANAEHEESNLRSKIASSFPGIESSGRHAYKFEFKFEDALSKYFNTSLFADHQEELTDNIKKSDGSYKYLIDRNPEQVVAAAKAEALDFCNRQRSEADGYILMPREFVRLLVRDGII